jgi:hypothetical protein
MKNEGAGREPLAGFNKEGKPISQVFKFSEITRKNMHCLADDTNMHAKHDSLDCPKSLKGGKVSCAGDGDLPYHREYDLKEVSEGRGRAAPPPGLSDISLIPF